MPFPSGEPPWQTAILTNLANENKLSGVNPDILGAIAQEESGFEDAGAGFNGQAGGYFGLEPKNYPGNNSETVAQLLTNSQASFTQQAITAAAAFNSYLQEANGNPARAETIYQDGGNSTGDDSPGVPLVLAAIGQGSPGGSSTYSTGTTPVGGSGTSSGSPGTDTNSSTPLTGVAGALQAIDKLMNPPGVGFLQDLESGGTAAIGQILETIVIRGLFAISFLGIAYIGVKSITGGSSRTVIDIVQQNAKNDLAQQRIDATNRQSESRENVANTKLETAKTPRESHVYHHSSTETTASAGAAAAGTDSIAAELAEGALLA